MHRWNRVDAGEVNRLVSFSRKFQNLYRTSISFDSASVSKVLLI